MLKEPRPRAPRTESRQGIGVVLEAERRDWSDARLGLKNTEIMIGPGGEINVLESKEDSGDSRRDDRRREDRRDDRRGDDRSRGGGRYSRSHGDDDEIPFSPEWR